MRYENTPRPTIEDHYHIRDLIEGQEKRANDRQSYRDRQKQREERLHIIQDSKLFVLTDFWCEQCKKDFKAQAVRQDEIDWTNTAQLISFYKTKHWCGTWCMRLVTDRHKDAFWIRSRSVRRDQGNHFADTVQPFETNYELLYSNKRK